MYSPVGRICAIKVVLPVADAVLLVESSVVGTHVRDSTSVFITHMEELTVELHVSIEANRQVCTVEGKGHIWELLPSFGLLE